MVIEIESDGGNRSLEEIAEELAKAIAPHGGLLAVRIGLLLIEFAEEIKRQSIEP